MNPTKTERDQWRERLSSPYTCFDAAHEDFTIRLLDALKGWSWRRMYSVSGLQTPISILIYYQISTPAR